MDKYSKFTDVGFVSYFDRSHYLSIYFFVCRENFNHITTKKAALETICNKKNWLLSICAFFIMITSAGMSGYLPAMVFLFPPYFLVPLAHLTSYSCMNSEYYPALRVIFYPLSQILLVCVPRISRFLLLLSQLQLDLLFICRYFFTVCMEQTFRQ